MEKKQNGVEQIVSARTQFQFFIADLQEKMCRFGANLNDFRQILGLFWLFFLNF